MPRDAVRISGFVFRGFHPQRLHPASGGAARINDAAALGEFARGQETLETHELSRDGKQFEYQTLHLWEIQDGKLARFAECPLDLYEFDKPWQ